MFINGITDYDRNGNEVKTGLVIAKATCDGDIRITSNGKEAVSVRVRLNNPGTVSDAVTASAIIGSYSSYGQAPVSMPASSVVYASGSGTVNDFSKLAGSTDSAILKATDEYLAKVTPSRKSNYTGLLKDYNLITICAESFCPWFIS